LLWVVAVVVAGVVALADVMYGVCRYALLARVCFIFRKHAMTLLTLLLLLLTLLLLLCHHPCREHLPYAQQQQALYPHFAATRLGFLAIIAFPHYYAASLGELGSRQWAQWGTRLAALGIPVRCCFLDCLSYTRGLQSSA
jgi:hypothetical protein